MPKVVRKFTAQLRRRKNKAALLLSVLGLVSCATTINELPSLSDAALCDIATDGRDRQAVRYEATLELEKRGSECDELSAEIRRQRLQALRKQLEINPNEDGRKTYTDCVMIQTCQENGWGQ